MKIFYPKYLVKGDATMKHLSLFLVSLNFMYPHNNHADKQYSLLNLLQLHRKHAAATQALIKKQCDEMDQCLCNAKNLHQEVKEKITTNLKNQHTNNLKNLHIYYDAIKEDFLQHLSDNEKIMYEIMQNNTDSKPSKNFFNSPSFHLFKLCQNKNTEPTVLVQSAQMLLEQGANPNFTFNSLSLLRVAVVNGQPEIVSVLLEHGSKASQDDIVAAALKLKILETCYIEQLDPYPGVSLEHDKQTYQQITTMLQTNLMSQRSIKTTS